MNNSSQFGHNFIQNAIQRLIDEKQGISQHDEGYSQGHILEDHVNTLSPEVSQQRDYEDIVGFNDLHETAQQESPTTIMWQLECEALLAEQNDLKKENTALKIRIDDLTQQMLSTQAHNKSKEDDFSSFQEQTLRAKQRIEKCLITIQDQEKRIAELEALEYSYKKMSARNHELELRLQREEHLHAILEKEKKDAQTLQEENDTLRMALELTRKEMELCRQQEISLQQHVEEKDRQWHSSQMQLQQLNHALVNAQEQKQETLDELEAICKQFERLKAMITSYQSDLDARSHEIFLIKQAMDSLKYDKRHLEELLQQKNAICAARESELYQVKQNLQRSVQEQDDHAMKYIEVAAENVSLLEDIQRLQQQVEKQSEEIQNLQTQLQEGEIKYNSKDSESQQIANSLVQQTQNVDNLVIEKQHLIETQQHLQSQLEEEGLQLKIAQQHLAKKVMEIALLHEKSEEQESQVRDLQTHMLHAQDKIAELRNQLDAHQQQEKHLQELHQNAIASWESQTKHWEDKYHRLHSQHELLEAANKKLTITAEKYQQMHTLLANMGSVINPLPQSNTRQVYETSDENFVQASIHEEYRIHNVSMPSPFNQDARKDTRFIQEELFTSSQPMTRYKRNLFDE